jgi:hypothetical protein
VEHNRHSEFNGVKQMSVVTKYENDNKLFLEIDNGDLSNMQEVIKKWNFKDEQALWRFCLSLLLSTQDKTLWIKEEGERIRVTPANHNIRV